MLDQLCSNGPPHTPAEYESILLHMGTSDIIFGILLGIGSMVSVIPQHVKIFKTKETMGISPFYLFLSNCNQFSGALNALFLKFPQLNACRYVGFKQCGPSILTLFQLFGLWIFTFPIFIWFLIFTPNSKLSPRRREWVLSSILFFVFGGFMICMSFAGVGLLHRYGQCGKSLIDFGFGLGILSTILTFIQWTPQIYKTYTTKGSGSFSVLMLCIQAPGSLIIVYFLAFVSKESVSTWLSYLAASVQMIVLIVMLVYYDRTKRARDYQIINDSVESFERAGLLSNLEDK